MTHPLEDCLREQPKINKQLLPPPGVDDLLANPDKLFNSKLPNLAIQSEKPAHRVIVYLKAQGLSNREIAEKLGYTQPWVSQITRQPWFQNAVVEEIRRAGEDVVAKFLEGETLSSVQTLVAIRDDEAQKGATRVSAANAILDRALGKPTQYVQAETITRSGEAQKEMEQLERELHSIKESQKSLGLN